jgi:hypothetical protein
LTGVVVAIGTAVAVLVILGSVWFVAPFFDGDVGPGADVPLPEVTTSFAPEVPTSAISAAGSVELLGWEEHELEKFVTFPAVWRNGYVGLFGSEVASSTDGVVWTAWGQQPDVLAALVDDVGVGLAVVDDQVVFVAGLESWSLVAFVADSPDSWREIEIPASTTRSRPLFIEVGDTTLMIDQGIWIVDYAWSETGSDTEVVARDIGWGVDAEPAWVGAVLPDNTRAVEAHGGRFTAFNWADPDADPEAWTSVDAVTWVPIAPVAMDGRFDCQFPSPAALTPAIVEAGGIGWFAAGGDCAKTVFWYSHNGEDWTEIEALKGKHAVFDIWVAFPPVFLVEDDRVLIYGNSGTSNTVTPNTPSVWIGTSQS